MLSVFSDSLLLFKLITIPIQTLPIPFKVRTPSVPVHYDRRDRFEVYIPYLYFNPRQSYLHHNCGTHTCSNSLLHFQTLLFRTLHCEPYTNSLPISFYIEVTSDSSLVFLHLLLISQDRVSSIPT